MKIIVSSFVTFLTLSSTAFAATVTIDFEAFNDGDLINTIGNATFTSNSNVEIYNFSSLANSGVNTIARSGGNFDGDLFVDFSTPVSSLSFFSGADDNTQQASINVFTDGVFSTTVGLVGDGDSTTTDFQDLTSFVDVTRIEIVDVTDAGGLLYDDFSYTVDPQVVPLPAAGWLLLGGIAGLGGLSRRKKKVG